MNDLENAVVLLKATLEILRKADEGPYVQDVLALTAHYDGTECDGACLMQDIDDFLSGLPESEEPHHARLTANFGG